MTSTVRSELDGNVHPDFHRFAVLACRAESPFFKRINGDLIELPVERSDDANDVRYTVLWNHSVQHN